MFKRFYSINIMKLNQNIMNKYYKHYNKNKIKKYNKDKQQNT